MSDFLFTAYPWVKSLHVISVIAWMAGLFYLPRLFVHHVEQAGDDPNLGGIFTMMEIKLLKLIMNPSMIAAWFFGFLLVMTPGIITWSEIWPWIKALSVIAMTWFHFWLAGCLKGFKIGKNMRSGRTFRIMNEIPTILMIFIVFSVIARPF